MLIIASFPGLPRSVRVLIMCRRHAPRIIITRTERGRPGTEAMLIISLRLLFSLSVFISITVTIL